MTARFIPEESSPFGTESDMKFMIMDTHSVNSSGSSLSVRGEPVE